MIPKRSIALGLATALVLAGGAVAATGSGKGVDESHTLTGTWLATVDRGPAGPLKSLQTYARSGVFTETSNVVPSGLRGPGHGSWSQADHHSYDTTELFLRYDPGTGNWAGYLKLRSRIQLGRDGDSFTAVVVRQALDTGGNPIGPPSTDSTVGQRIEVEPLPG